MFQAGILTSLRLLLLPISRLTNSGFNEDRLIRVTAADTVSDFHRIPILIPTNIGNQKHCKCTFKPEIVKIFGLYISKKIENPKVFYLDFIKKKHQTRTEVNL